MRNFLLLIVSATFFAATAVAQTYTGNLGPGDARLNSGEYYHTYDFHAEAGQDISVVMTSNDVDTYLILIHPDQQDEQNDDWQNSTSMSRIDSRARQSGTHQVMATSYAGGETGSYRLEITTGGSQGANGGRGRQNAASDIVTWGRGSASGTRTERGVLSARSGALRTGEFREVYTFEGRRGESVAIDLRSNDFDPYLILVFPNGEQVDNDDWQNSLTHSRIETTLPEDGTYRVTATSFAPGETGAFELTIAGGSSVASGAVAARTPPEAGSRNVGASSMSGVRVERGRLQQGAQTLRSGEFVDRYTFEGRAGQPVRIDLRTDDFDPYLILQFPDGQQVENDDYQGDLRHSALELALPAAGTYTVLATSYRSGEAGRYELSMNLDARSGQVAQIAAETAARPPAVQPQTPGTRRTSRSHSGINHSYTGTLDSNDRRLNTGEYFDEYTFSGVAGEPIRIDLHSADFDPYLIVRTPGGEQFDNDDWENSHTQSRVEMLMPETGTYEVQVTSYRAAETGAYRLEIRQEGAMEGAPAGYANIFGLFVGVSDYGGRQSNLQYTAEDATSIHDAMVRGAGMAPENGIILRDRDATIANFRRAVEDFTRRADENTMFVLFFSGHGGQYARSTPQPTDPDGMDESIELFDGHILDDELAALLAPLRSNLQLIVLDACFSGGFAKDLITQPGRMGLFSSEEDVISYVASSFEAGGYLSRFFADALVERAADEDGNGIITALELSTYLRRRYEQNVRDRSNVVLAGETRLGHQVLIVDRGSVGPFSTLFELP